MSILKDSTIYVGGEILSKIMPFLLIPYLSRKLGVEGYGELAYYQAYMMLMFLFISLSQDGAVSRYFYVYGKRSLDLIIRTGYIFSSIIGTIIFLIAYFNQATILMYLAIAVTFQVFMTVQLSVRQCQKQAIPYAIVQFLQAFIPFTFTILLFEVYGTNLVEMRFLAVMLGYTLTFVIAYWLYQQKKNKIKRFTFAQYKTAFFYIIAFGLPLIFHHGSFFIKGQLDRFFIYHQYSEIELGIYAMGANLAMIIGVLIQAINKAIMPYYFEGIRDKKCTLSKIYLFVLVSFIVIAVVFLTLSMVPENLYLWIIGDKFAGVKYYFSLFALATLLSIPYLALVNYLFYFGKTKVIAICSVFSTFCYLTVLILLISKGIEYIPYSSIVSAVSIIPFLIIATKRIKI